MCLRIYNYIVKNEDKYLGERKMIDEGNVIITEKVITVIFKNVYYHYKNSNKNLYLKNLLKI